MNQINSNEISDSDINHSPDHVGPLGHGTRRLGDATDTVGHRRLTNGESSDDGAEVSGIDAALDTGGRKRVRIAREGATDDVDGHRRLR